MEFSIKRILKNSFILSILFHLLSAAILLRLEKKTPDLSSRPIDVSLIEVQDPTTSQKKNDQMQIVDQSEKSVNKDTPDNAKFLSRNNQKVIEETKAANHGRFNNDAAQGIADPGKQEKGAEGAKAIVSQAQKNLGDKKPKTPPWEVERTKSGLPTLAALQPKFDWSKVAGQGSRRPAVEHPGDPSSTDDYLKDVKTGAQTILNTREFIYFSYYNRIKSQLQQYWEPKIKAKVTRLFQQGRQIASDQDRITKVRITLNDKGTLIGVAVVNDSGVRELDEAAIEAFRAAAPFPNPPKGIVESDGTIKIDWSFILEAGLMEPDPQILRASRSQDLF